MPAILICTHEGGQILVNAFPDDQIPPELLQDAQPAASLEEAASMVQDVLGAGAEGQQTGGEEGAGDQPGPEAMEAEPADTDSAIEAGYNRAKKGR